MYFPAGVCPREQSAYHLHWRPGMEVTRLLCLVQVVPVLVGVDAWMLAVLGIGEQVAQGSAERKRRHQARHTRALVRAEVQRVLRWQARATEG